MAKLPLVQNDETSRSPIVLILRLHNYEYRRLWQPETPPTRSSHDIRPRSALRSRSGTETTDSIYTVSWSQSIDLGGVCRCVACELTCLSHNQETAQKRVREWYTPPRAIGGACVQLQNHCTNLRFHLHYI